jgi:hypothetical protein
MSQTLPLNMQCYLCDVYYGKNPESFLIYKCLCCFQITSYCYSCNVKLRKLFDSNNVFKCAICNRFSQSIENSEINPLAQPINFNSISNNNSLYGNTVIIPIQSHNNIDLPFSKKEIEKKIITDFINKIGNMNLAVNSNKNNDRTASINKFSLKRPVLRKIRNDSSEDSRKYGKANLSIKRYNRFDSSKSSALINRNMSKIYRNKNTFNSNGFSSEEEYF